MVPPSRRLWLKRLALASAGLLASPFLTEGLLRLADPWGARFKVTMWRFVEAAKRPDPVRSWRFQPGFAGDYGVHIRLNAHGFRGPEWEPLRPGERRVLVLGDSYAFGYAVREEAAFTSILERRLGTPFRVLNAGVIGYNTDQERMTLREEGLAAEPETVLLLFVPNDWEPADGREQKAWRRAHPLRGRIALGPHGCFPYTCLYLMNYLQWRFRLFDDLPAAADWETCLKALAEMFEDCRANGVRFGVLLHEDCPAARACFERKGIPHAVLFRDHAAAARHALCPIDSHPNAEGHRLIAEGFLALMRGQGWLSPAGRTANGSGTETR